MDEFLSRLSEKQLTLFYYLDGLIKTFPGISTKIRYKIPFYDYYSWVCYINPIKTEGVELCFIKGKELSNSHGLLKSKDRKMIAGITLENLEDISEESLIETIAEALYLDEKSNKKKTKS